MEPGSYSCPNIDGNAVMLGRLFITMSGYVGMALGNVRSEDEVWLLAGCQMPVLLRKNRKVEGAYELMGGMYIPGLMKGEALKGVGKSEDLFETVFIC